MSSELLYHGTNRARRILRQGFVPSDSKVERLGTGVYFAVSAEQARSYGPQVLVADTSKLRLKEMTNEEFLSLCKDNGGVYLGLAPINRTIAADTFGDNFDGIIVSNIYTDSDEIGEDYAATEVLIFDADVARAAISAVI